MPDAENGEEPRALPPYVIRPSEIRRWQLCEAVALALFPERRDTAVAWQTMRSLYWSDVPTNGS